MIYRYYLTQRPPTIGTQPRGAINVVAFEEKQVYNNIYSWGYVEYKNPLTAQQVNDYELMEV